MLFYVGMKGVLAAAPLLLGALVLACGEDDSKPALEVDPVTACPKSKCPPAEGGTADGTGDPEADAPAQPTPPPTTTEEGKTDPVNTCQTAASLGEMAGEPTLYGEEPNRFSAQGNCSKWLKLRVLEDSNGYNPLGLTATLVSPSERKFDLHAYVNPTKDEISCTTPAASSATTLSNIDEILLKWGDSWSNDDSRTVTIEVRAKGECDESSSWSLLVSSVTTPWTY